MAGGAGALVLALALAANNKRSREIEAKPEVIHQNLETSTSGGVPSSPCRWSCAFAPSGLQTTNCIMA
jgi:hypothetical protein